MENNESAAESEESEKLQLINTGDERMSANASPAEAIEEEKKAFEPAEPLRRLMIAKIELNNFKSYYGNKVIGPLHKNFTAVVGPNGSGKSNLIESLLFVFGKRAKQMRLNRLSELIHKSADHPDVENATVTVSF